MKNFKAFILAAVAVCCLSTPAAAQFKWGVQAGIVANELKFNSSMFDSSNRVGFTGGLTAQFNLPFGLGFQGSVMYVHKTSDVTVKDDKLQETKEVFNADYLTVPIHFKYNIGLPVVGKFLRPFVFTGPSFSYRLSKNSGVSKGDIEWDFGIGADIINRIQLNVGYGIGCYKMYAGFNQKVRTNSWTVTLGYLF